MGVQGLWKLVEPAARPVRLETLNGRRLAVDASIWLHQFLKAMRTKDGKPMAGAHLQGFFRRICKLLYFGIYPVFVFDGRTPELKKIALRKRRAARTKAQDNIEKTAHKILVKNMQLHLLKERTKSKDSTRKGQKEAGTDFFDDELYYMDENGKHISSREIENVENVKQNQNPKGKGDVRGMISSQDDRLISNDEMRSFIEQSREDVDISSVNLDDISFKNLPIEIQHDIITELKLRSRMASQKRVDTMLQRSKDSRDFSKMQIKHLVVRNDITQRAYEFAKNAGVINNPALKKRLEDAKKRKGKLHSALVSQQRVAGERNTEFFFISDANGPAEVSSDDIPVEDTKDSPKHTENILDNEFFGNSLASLRAKRRVDRDEDEDEIKSKRVVGSDDGYSIRKASKRERKVVDITKDARPYADTVKLDDHYFDSDADVKDEYEFMDQEPSLELISEQKAIFESHKSKQSTSDNIEHNDIIIISGHKAENLILDDSSSETVESIADALIPSIEAVTSFEKERLCRYLIEKCIPDEYLVVNSSIATLITEALVVWDISKFNAYLAEQDKEIMPHLRISFDESILSENYVNKFQYLITGFSNMDYKMRIESIKTYMLCKMYLIKVISLIMKWRIIKKDFNSYVINREPIKKKISITDSDSDKSNIKILDDEIIHDDDEDDDFEEIDNTYVNNKNSEKLDLSKIEPGTVESVKCEESNNFELFKDLNSSTDSNAMLEPDFSQFYSMDMFTTNNFETISENEDSRFLNKEQPTVIIEDLGESDEELIDLSNNTDEINRIVLVDDGIYLKDSSSTEISSEILNPKNNNIAIENEQVDYIENLTSKTEKANVEKLANLAEKLDENVLERSISGIPLEKATNINRKSTKADIEIEADVDSARKELNKVESFEVIAEDDDIKADDKSTTIDAKNYDDLDLTGIDCNVDIDLENQEFEAFLNNASLNNKNIIAVGDDSDSSHQIQTIEELQNDILILKRKQNQDESIAQNVESEHIFEIQQLLSLFNIPYMTAYTEAESQCSFLADHKLVDGIITDDSDVFLFGGPVVYKNMFNQQKYVEEYSLSTLIDKMQLTRDRLIQLTYLLGSDYSEGIEGIGITNAIEILDVWKGEKLYPLKMFKKFYLQEKKSKEVVLFDDEDLIVDSILPPIEESKIDPKVIKRFRKLVEKIDHLPASFPDERIYDAYNNPVVNNDETNFVWGSPNIDLVKQFMVDKGLMNIEQINKALIPVINQINEDKKSKKSKQTSIDSYITIQPKIVHHKSGRIDNVIQKWNKKKK